MLKTLEIFFWYNLKMQKEEVFKLVRISTEKDFSEVRKKVKTNIRNLDFDKKMANSFFFKRCMLAPQESTFSEYN